MTVNVVIKPNTYIDSVSLMAMSTKANQLDGVEQAFIAMATDMNKGVLDSLGLLTPELAQAAGGDLMIVVVSEEGADTDAIDEGIALLLARKAPADGDAQITHRTLASAVEADPAANLAVIAVNGAFAAREARKALERGLHVMLFSDNVPVDDEIALKALAHEKGLLMMGPDCGTAIIDGVGLCFANKVRRGRIGVVAASGTGSQEVSVRVHALGAGISQLIGTGGRDLSAEVGGVMMIDGIRALAADPDTDVIVLVSKPPADEVAEKVLREVASAGKPVVVYFIGGAAGPVEAAGGHFAASSEDAAVQAVRLTGAADAQESVLDEQRVAAARARLGDGQRYVRGLFCGGTLCDEAMYAVAATGAEVNSNLAKEPDRQIGPGDPSRGHTFIDFGSDEYTDGKPHPMIDPSNRLARLAQEAADPSVAVIVMDFVLGFGAHEDPAGVTLEAIADAQRIAAEDGRQLEIVGYVLGTDVDTPSLDAQRAALEAAGVTVTRSSTETGRYISAVVAKEAHA